MFFPFSESPESEVITCDRILTGEAWVHYITRDDDGAWQFHPNDRMTTVEDVRVITLEEMLVVDPSVGQVADMPRGWHAFRGTPGGSWTQEPQRD